jgi:hypothetical protein
MASTVLANHPPLTGYFQRKQAMNTATIQAPAHNYVDPAKAAADNFMSVWAVDFSEFEKSLPDTMKYTPQLTSKYDFSSIVPGWAKVTGQQGASI